MEFGEIVWAISTSDWTIVERRDSEPCVASQKAAGGGAKCFSVLLDALWSWSQLVAPHRLMPSADLRCSETIHQWRSVRWRLEQLQLQQNCQQQTVLPARRRAGRHGEHTNHSQRARDVHHRCNGEDVRFLEGLSQMPERSGHAHTCVSSAHAQQYGVASVAPQAPTVDTAVDRHGREAGGEKRDHEMRSWVPLTTCKGWQITTASRNRVRAARFAGSWDSRLGPLMRSQVLKKRSSRAPRRRRCSARDSSKQHVLEVGNVLAALALEDLIPARPVYGTMSGTELDPQAVAAGRRKQASLEEQKAIILVPRDLPLDGAKRIRIMWLTNTTPETPM